MELHARIHSLLKLPLVFTALACLDIQQVMHAKAVNSNLTNQLKKRQF